MDRFLLLLKAHGLPLPLTEVEFHSTRKWRFDYAWVQKSVAVEVEGGAFTQGRHTRGAGYLKDLQKYNAAAINGWTVLRYTPSQLTSQQTIDEIRLALR